MLRIGLDDLPLILSKVAEAAPETVSVLAAAASTAGMTALEQAKMIRRVAVSTVETLEEPIDELNNYLHVAYLEAPGGDDADERYRLDLIETVSDSVQALAHFFQQESATPSP